MSRFTTTIRAGALIRREVRRTLMQFAELRFREDKGLLDSFFVVEGPEELYASLKLALSDFTEFD